MMVPPDPDDPIVPYDEPRGICPQCGSHDVTHLVIGLPGHPDHAVGDPDWVSWVGCMHPGFDRRCEDCQATWTAGSP